MGKMLIKIGFLGCKLCDNRQPHPNGPSLKHRLGLLSLKLRLLSTKLLNLAEKILP
jgi:hypothetical protein